MTDETVGWVKHCGPNKHGAYDGATKFLSHHTDAQQKSAEVWYDEKEKRYRGKLVIIGMTGRTANADMGLKNVGTLDNAIQKADEWLEENGHITG